MAALPKILAGPILRRCDTREINIWVAASEQLKDFVPKFFYRGNMNRVPADVDKANLIEIQVFTNLWIYLIPLKPKGGFFGADKEIKFDLEYTDVQGEKGFMAKERTVYGGGTAMSVMLQPEGENQKTGRFLYGSCRKSGGPRLDAALAGDALLRGTLSNSKERPHALFLTGDQIYGDDVTEMMSNIVSSLAHKIAPDVYEQFPWKKSDSSILEIYKSSGLTSDHAAFHLLTLAEFCAMYILAWNDEIGIWPEKFPVPSKYKVAMGKDAIYADEIEDAKYEHIPIKKEWAKNFRHQYLLLQEFRQGSGALSRIMANTPTYMIFDDHEITDDWFLNNRWKQKQYVQNKIGRRIITNGLAAYWLFQGLGNAPHQFKVNDMKKKLQAHVAYMVKHRNKPLNHVASAYEYAFKSVDNWSFVTQTYPRVLFVDTRTARSNSSRSKNHREWVCKESFRIRFKSKKVEAHKDSVRLLEKKAYSHLTRLISGSLAQDPRLVLVVPGPVFGMETIEKVQEWSTKKPKPLKVPDALPFLVSPLFLLKDLGNALPLKTPAEADLESWHSNLNSFIDLMKWIMTFKGLKVAAILSGDVHYGFSIPASLMDLNGGRSPSIPIAQFTSSSMKNFTEDWLLKNASLILTTKSAHRRLRIWMRKDENRAHGSIYDGIPIHRRVMDLGHENYERHMELFHEKSSKNSAKTNFATAFKYTKGPNLPNIVNENNMGFVEFSAAGVKNKLIHVSGHNRKPRESLATDWKFSHWPVELR